MTKNIRYYFINFILTILFFFLINFIFSGVEFKNIFHDDLYKEIRIEIKAKTYNNQRLQIFYKEKDDKDFTARKCITKDVEASDKFQTISFILPKNLSISSFRLDIGNQFGNCDIEYIKLTHFDKEYKWNAKDIVTKFTSNYHISKLTLNNDVVNIKVLGIDPFIVLTENITNIYNEIANNNNEDNSDVILSIILSLFFFFFVHYKILFKVNNEKNTLSYSVLISVIFFILIFLPLLNDTFSFYNDKAHNEKRKLVEKPYLEFNKLFSFPSKYNAYFNDHFQFRNLLVYWNSYFKAKVLKTSPKPELVIIGKNDWLFHTWEIEDYKCINSFSKEQLERIKINQEIRRDSLAKRGIKYYILINPNKQFVYSEYLPDYIRRKDTIQKFEQVIDYLQKNSTVTVIDVRREFLEAKKKERIYGMHDTHWNFIAAFIAYTKLINEIKNDFPEIEPLKITDFDVKKGMVKGGDLTMMLALDSAFSEEGVKYIPKFKEKALPISRFILAKRYRETGIDSLPKMMMYRDSYTSLLEPFLSENFSKSIYIWNYNVNLELIDKEKPDIVILQITARAVPSLLTL